MNTDHRNLAARRVLPIALLVTASSLALATPGEATGCTVLDQPPGQMIARVAPFNGQINPGNPNGLDAPVVPTLCRPDAP